MNYGTELWTPNKQLVVMTGGDSLFFGRVFGNPQRSEVVFLPKRVDHDDLKNVLASRRQHSAPIRRTY